MSIRNNRLKFILKNVYYFFFTDISPPLGRLGGVDY